MNALERGMELLTTPMNKLPPKALKFARFMCDRYMMCGEVFLTAYTVYAQREEGLTCDDPLYSAYDLQATADWHACFGE